MQQNDIQNIFVIALTFKISISSSFCTHLFHVSSINCSISASSSDYTIRMICFNVVCDNNIFSISTITTVILDWCNIGWCVAGSVQWSVGWFPVQQGFLPSSNNIVLASISSILIADSNCLISLCWRWVEISVCRRVRRWACMTWASMTSLLWKKNDSVGVNWNKWKAEIEFPRSFIFQHTFITVALYIIYNLT